MVGVIVCKEHRASVAWQYFESQSIDNVKREFQVVVGSSWRSRNDGRTRGFYSPSSKILLERIEEPRTGR